MPAIFLTQGYVALVDDVDGDLSELRWNVQICGGIRYARKTFLSTTTVSGQCVLRMHRVILSRMLGRELNRGEVVDHVNGDGLDNRRSNIRLATISENSQNSPKRCTNRSGYKGVSWHKGSCKWQARILPSKGLSQKHLGYFDTPVEAHEAYKIAAVKYYKEFARFE